MPEKSIEQIDLNQLIEKAISKPLVSHIYTADPSAHVFNDKIYIYPSHDIDAGIPFNDNGDHFGMEDYHVISMDSIESEAVDNGLALHVNDVPWAKKQMWAPDAAHKDGKYYLFFPAKNKEDIFQIGVAVGHSPIGPFIPQPKPINGSYSIDPAIFEDEDGSYYLYFGGIWGGQLQNYRDNIYSCNNDLPKKEEPALGPIVAKMTDDMLEFCETPKEILILDESGSPLLEGDNDRRFFEASWVHKYNNKYYFSYSTGDTHFICYAIGDSPYGPFTYKGRILEPVIGWTSHHSICQVEGKWYLFYHDSSLSNGVTHLRSIKVNEIIHDENGLIQTLSPYGK
ncbi:glycoside hydrolase family 43 protein [Aestuariibaculum suncheonense]|uniref:Glycoside hydrolase family 43 protein n=1 Tax=Aestuariibaculum suncheonense TaxID=1028745 RepID=A0A8J6UAP9_9FLAO|nr:glycoside hydrolase family 43 protein [Aestuariibaculum suncheonense]MBD0835095.1 glycoside hydrolase family 43 protein [Aestuariibaculum suncheonense]